VPAEAIRESTPYRGRRLKMTEKRDVQALSQPMGFTDTARKRPED
jgi:hypothetical protein